MLYKCSVEILVEADSEAEACDAIAETLRPVLQTFEPESSVIDWRWNESNCYPEEHDGRGFEYQPASSRVTNP